MNLNYFPYSDIITAVSAPSSSLLLSSLSSSISSSPNKLLTMDAIINYVTTISEPNKEKNGSNNLILFVNWHGGRHHQNYHHLANYSTIGYCPHLSDLQQPSDGAVYQSIH